MPLGENIKRLRKLNNLTQQRLADQLNKSKTLIALWEKEERDPSSMDLKRMAEIFNVKLDELLDTLPVFQTQKHMK